MSFKLSIFSKRRSFFQAVSSLFVQVNNDVSNKTEEQPIPFCRREDLNQLMINCENMDQEKCVISQTKQLILMSASHYYMNGKIESEEFRAIKDRYRTDYVGAMEALSRLQKDLRPSV